jgi:hypothetical protein
MLEELGIELWVGDPARIRKAAPRQQKTDRNDARLLLQLLEENRFPRIWVPDRATRDLRQLLMHRHHLVRMRRGISNQLQAIALNRGLQRKRALWNQQGREQLKALELPLWTTVRRNELLALREQWDAEIAVFDRVVLEQAEANPEARYLMQHQPGVGPITALTVVLTLGPVERFASAPQGGQLRWPGPGRVLQRCAPAAGPPQQGGQSLPALGAGGVGHRGRAPRPGDETDVLEAGRAAWKIHRQSSDGAQAAHPPLLDVAPAKRSSRLSSAQPRRRQARGLTWPHYRAVILSEQPASRATSESSTRESWLQ